jgi:hypothetical protein
MIASIRRVLVAFPGDRCRRSADCTGGGPQFCLADSLTSTTGRCVAGRVLP